MPTARQLELLENVTRTRSILVQAQASIEERVRAALNAEIAVLQSAVDIATRAAYDAGNRKADILRASLTKNFSTMQQSLDRTEGLSVALEENEGSKRFSWVDDRHDKILVIEGDDFVVFTKQYRNDTDDYIFWSTVPLWNDDFTEQNKLVWALDGRTDTELAKAASDWVKGENDYT